MEFWLRPLGFMEFFYKTTIIRQLTKWNESKIEKYSQKPFHGIKYIILIYIYLLLYDSSTLDIDHSPYYIPLGSTQTHEVI